MRRKPLDSLSCRELESCIGFLGMSLSGQVRRAPGRVSMARYRQERSKPVGTIVGVVVCLGAIGGFLILISTGIISFDKKAPVPPPRASGTGTKTPTPHDNGSATGTNAKTSPPASPGEVRVSFLGTFTQRGDTRKLAYTCPHCQKNIVDVRVPKCPNCAKAIKWPQKVPCGFCSGKGQCKFCKGTGNCPACGQGHRMLMGVKPPCETCNTTGKCPSCSKTRACTFCESGTFFPGKPKAPEKPASETPPSIPKPQPE